MSEGLWKKVIDFVVDEITGYHNQRLDAYRLHMSATVFMKVMTGSAPLWWPEDKYVRDYLETGAGSTLYSGQREDLVQVYRVIRAMVFKNLDPRVANELECFLSTHRKRKPAKQPAVERPHRRVPAYASRRSREA